MVRRALKPSASAPAHQPGADPQTQTVASTGAQTTGAQTTRTRSNPPSAGQQDSQPGGLEGVASRAESQSSPLSGLGPVSKVIGILLLVFSATGLFAQFQHALNRAWEVEPDPEQSGIWSFIFKRLLSLGMVAVIAFLLLVSLVLTTALDELVRLVTGGSSGTIATVIGFVLNSVATLAVATLLFAAMFKLLPDARMRWKDTWVGAFLTAVLFVIGKSLLGWYLQSSEIGSTWGSAAASMIAMLVWVYYTTLIVLFGAELAQVWAVRYGAGIEPAKGAVRIVEQKRHVRESAA
jgi:membrane protein